MSKLLLTHDAATQTSEFMYFEPGSDTVTIRVEQDVTRILDANKAEFNDDHGRHGDGLGRKVASIPLGIYMDLRKRGIVQDRKAFRRWLNDPDNAAFRTSPGRV